MVQRGEASAHASLERCEIENEAELGGRLHTMDVGASVVGSNRQFNMPFHPSPHPSMYTHTHTHEHWVSGTGWHSTNGTNGFIKSNRQRRRRDVRLKCFRVIIRVNITIDYGMLNA